MPCKKTNLDKLQIDKKGLNHLSFLWMFHVSGARVVLTGDPGVDAGPPLPRAAVPPRGHAHQLVAQPALRPADHRAAGIALGSKDAVDFRLRDIVASMLSHEFL